MSEEPLVRTVSHDIEIDMGGRSQLVFSSAVHDRATFSFERVRFTLDGDELTPIEVVEDDGTRLHLLELTKPGRLGAHYEAVIEGQSRPNEPKRLDEVIYRRPSRYAESDYLGPTSRAMFTGLKGWALIDAVEDWVHGNLRYLPGASIPTDGAEQTLMHRKGVCRDYAHLVCALLRAHDVPARLVSVYAPQLKPMDFHAVAEVLVDGAWYVIDATRLAPRERMLRIATGRDAADTAWLTNTLASLKIASMKVAASSNRELEVDPSTRVQLR